MTKITLNEINIGDEILLEKGNYAGLYLVVLKKENKPNRQVYITVGQRNNKNFMKCLGDYRNIVISEIRRA